MKKTLLLLMLSATFAIGGCTARPYGVFDESYDYGYRNYPDHGYHHDHDRRDEGRYGGDRGGYDDRDDGRDDD
ncbi:hypothetical protein A9404_00590 [Halothiobacillus diazotrophicus]|uniref:Lipoprotein n=1 Tax=Halothiobacillus diazotrophicus TaxID=1860122 RepID=A0A191ZDX7_9GAMM|nr:hypothetical protein [Halothiobacillus diazotrophicus]ANJ66076.1 hypothetical protein A9404_00590 [Halothiobacillus diazotrophicus]